MPRQSFFLVPDRSGHAVAHSARPLPPPRIGRGRDLPFRCDGLTSAVGATVTDLCSADQIQVVQEVCDWLEDAIGTAAQCRDKSALLQHARDRALLLMLFWRRVASAELLAMQVENIDIAAPGGVTCHGMTPSGQRSISWHPIAHPALKSLCPVAALQLWLSVSGLRHGPLFPRIKHGGDLASEGLPPDSVWPLLLGLVALSHGADDHAAS